MSGDLLFFLDDDAALPHPTRWRVRCPVRGRPEVGLIQPRVVDPTGRPAPGRWVPRLRMGDPAEPSPATSLWEGAVAIRRSLFDAVGGWPDCSSTRTRASSCAGGSGTRATCPWYAADLVMHHPVIDPRRHDEYWHMNARNRVLLARRNLPVVLRPVYVGTWAAMTAARVRDRRPAAPGGTGSARAGGWTRATVGR